MAGANNFNANKMTVTVFDGDGNEYTVSRPNAREMVQSGNFFWKAEDIGVARTEAAGPEDPTADVMTVHAVDTGEEIEVTRANARDMVGSGKYTWAPAHADTSPEETGEEDAKTDESIADAPVSDAPVADEISEPKAEDPLDPLNSPLKEIAERVTGDSDVAAYLGGFTEENLREMAEQRYGEKMHHRSSKETIISKMVELEDAKLTSHTGTAPSEG